MLWSNWCQWCREIYFLKILNGDIEPTSGNIIKGTHDRISYLVQDHNAYDDYNVIETVIAGDKELYEIKKKRMLYI